MTCFVFLGPSLPVDEARPRLEAEYLPPARQGDIAGLVAGAPRAIVLIDGLFHHVGSVWHREILFALDRGIHVFGASSMGALRAVELAPFGMRGIGQVVGWYTDGTIDGDDEVALLHAPTESGYRPLSEALVNIRATVAAAVGAGLVAEGAGRRLIECARALPFGERTYPALLAAAGRAGDVATGDLEAFERFAAASAVDVKRADALAALDEVASFLASDPPPFAPASPFEEGYHWRRFLHGDLNLTAATGGRHTAAEAVARGRERPEIAAAAERRWLRRELSLRMGLEPTDADRAAVAEQLAGERGLGDREAVDRWLADARLDRVEFDRLIDDLARERSLDRIVESQLPGAILDELRLRGELLGP